MGVCIEVCIGGVKHAPVHESEFLTQVMERPRNYCKGPLSAFLAN